MLECFLKEAKYKKINNKLDFHIALDAAKICNDIEKQYKSKQSKWMKTINKTNIKKFSKEFLYCVKEIYSIRKNINQKDLEKYLYYEK